MPSRRKTAALAWNDISTQKRTERELADYRQDLERRVSERTTELATMTESLRSTHEQLQTIFNTSPAGILLVCERHILQCNHRFEELSAYSAAELIGRNTRMLHADPEAWARIEHEASALLQQGRTHVEEIELRRRDGSTFWAKMASRAINPADLSRGIVSTVEDISVERAAIAEMSRARTLAEEAAKTKSDFLANMSHEIRTPMNAIIGMTYLALKTSPMPRQRDYLLKIQRSSQHLLGIINDILDFSKIDAGKMEVESIEFELERVLDNVAGLMAEKTSAKGLELVVDVDADVPGHLLGDPLRIGQILINYVNNAVKFTESGEVVIHVRIAAANTSGLMLHFSVRDTGIGIGEAQRNALFQSFRQGDASITRRYGGTGLGLVIAKRLAGLMGGEVGVDSAAGTGSVFWFTAHVGRGKGPGRHPSSMSALPPCHVLIIDDNDSARRVTAELLRRLGCTVSAAASGTAAVAELERAAAAGAPCEFVLIDWKMPELDGIATAREIRTRFGPRPRPVLMLTAHQREGLMRSARQIGFDEILIKPVTAAALSELMQRMLQPDSIDAQAVSADSGSELPDFTALAGAQVLLVEDNELNQEVATELLHELGLDVDLAPDGAVALHKVQHRAYDLVLMDMQMPVLDGLAATRAIRKLPHLQALPIVAMTANAMSGDRERCIAAGMNDHLAKPIDPQALARTLLHWIRPAPHHPPARPALPAATSSPTDLAGVDGLDAELGLRQALGREALYRSLLTKFIASQADAVPRITAALAAADWTSAERHAHTLKGVAAQIGAGEIRLLAASLEQAIRDQLPDQARASLQARLASTLASLIAAISARLPRNGCAAPAATAIDAGQVQSVCRQLATQLAQDDFGCSQLLTDHAALLQAALGEDLERIVGLTERYDFAAALECLNQARQARGIAS